MKAKVPATVALVSIVFWAASARANDEAETAVGPERVEVNLVLIDVVVRDRKDRPVPGLERADFVLRVDGRAVRAEDVVSFEELCTGASPSVGEAAPAESRPLEPASRSAPAARLLIYFDFTQISFPGRQLALSAARRFLSGRNDDWPPTMIMAFSQGDPEVMQPFTTDAGVLAMRLDELLEDRATIALDLEEETEKIKAVAELAPPLRLLLARSFALEELQRARRSLRALRKALAMLDGPPGRKAMILFTDALRAEPGIQYLAQAGTTPYAQGISIDDEIMALARAANALGVSFYDVHAGGLQTGSEDSAMFKGPVAMWMTRYVKIGIDSAIGFQTTMAIETGGRALHNTNDPGLILGSAARDLSCYYVLGYRYEARGEGTRHDIGVKVRPRGQDKPRRGLQVRHRPYFMDRPQRPAGS